MPGEKIREIPTGAPRDAKGNGAPWATAATAGDYGSDVLDPDGYRIELIERS
jgi:hypothetical protein